MNPSLSDIVLPKVRPFVRQLRETDGERWTHFVAKHPEANLYHTLLWRDVIQEVFGHQPLYLLCEVGGKVCGVLPMFLVKLPWLGSKLVSMPYDIGSGGALTVDDKSECILVERAMELAREMRVSYLELRYGSRRQSLAHLGLQQSEPVLISEMELDSEAQVWARVSEDHRKAIRKAKNRGVTIREAGSFEDFCEFYQVYLRVFRDFGTPPYGANYFPILWRRLQASGAVRLLLAHAGQRCVGGLLFFCWSRNLISKFAACLPEAVPLRAYVALYWRAIQLGLELGYRRLNWGTSSRNQTGLIEFKERWGAHSGPAVLYDLPVRGSIPSIEKYYDSEGFMRRLWRRLPLSATPVVGGLINRWFC
jgi:hypothetical protein